jgi:stringent starvation protein B
MTGMSSNRPYLIRALYEWIVDNDLTPHLLVDAEAEHVVVPEQFVQEGRIVLNISPDAVRALDMGNDGIFFSARFGGISMDVSVPPTAVLGIYAKENGRGMLFPEDDQEASPPDEPIPPTPGGKKPTLKIVK